MIGLLKRPIGYIFLLIVGIAAGLYTSSTLPLSMYPPVQKPTIQVEMPIRGMSTVDAYETYQEDIEDSISKLKDVLGTRTYYYPGNLWVYVEFDYNKDREQARQEVVVAFESFRRLLPAGEQSLLSVGFREEEGQGMFAATVFSPTGEPMEQLYDRLRPHLEGPAERIPELNRDRSGLSKLSHREISIVFRPLDLAKYGLFLPQVLQDLRGQVSNIPSGRISAEKSTIYIRTVVNENTIEDLQNVVVASRSVQRGAVASTRVVRLSDIADVSLYRRKAAGVWRAQGSPALTISGYATPGGNLWRISHEMKQLLEKAKQRFGEVFDYKVYLDPAKYIDEAILSMLLSALIGTAIATLIIFLFLGQLRSTLLVAISIPSSLALSLILMNATGINLNMISLGGMALAVGMIVDSSIVVLENIFRFFEKHQPQTRRERIQWIAQAVSEVRWPVIISTLTSVIVFLPLSYTSAMANAILGDMSRVVVYALILSILAAIVYLPIFAVFLLKGNRQKGELALHRRWNQLLSRVAGAYLSALERLMRQKRRAFFSVVLLFVILFGISLPLANSIDKELVARPDALIYKMDLWARYINDQEKLLQLVEPMEQKLMGEKFGSRIEGVITKVHNKWGDIKVLLKPDTDPEEFGRDLEEAFPHTPDIRVSIERWNPTSLPLPEIRDLKVSIEPTDPANIEDARFMCQQLVARVSRQRENSPFRNAWCQPWDGVAREIKVAPLRQKLRRLGAEEGLRLSPQNIADYVRTATHQTWIGRIFFGGEMMPVYGKFPEDMVDNVEKIRNLPVVFGLGDNGDLQSYSLKTFADIEPSTVRPMVGVEDGRQVVTANGRLKFEHRDKKEEEQQKIRQIVADLEKEYPEKQAVMRYQNPYIEIDRSIQSLTFSLLLSLVLIFSLLVLQFQSLNRSLIIMLAIPLGIGGVMISLYVFGSTLSLNSMLGIILLSGIAVNNSILLVDFYRGIRRQGVAVKEAVLEAVKIRFRPIVMTMLTTIFAMLPLALNWGAGGKTLQPLGIAVSGGLLISTTFTLLVVPLALFLVSEWEAPEDSSAPNQS